MVRQTHAGYPMLPPASSPDRFITLSSFEELESKSCDDIHRQCAAAQALQSNPSTRPGFLQQARERLAIIVRDELLPFFARLYHLKAPTPLWDESRTLKAVDPNEVRKPKLPASITAFMPAKGISDTASMPAKSLSDTAIEPTRKPHWRVQQLRGVVRRLIPSVPETMSNPTETVTPPETARAAYGARPTGGPHRLTPLQSESVTYLSRSPDTTLLQRLWCASKFLIRLFAIASRNSLSIMMEALRPGLTSLYNVTSCLLRYLIGDLATAVSILPECLYTTWVCLYPLARRLARLITGKIYLDSYDCMFFVIEKHGVVKVVKSLATLEVPWQRCEENYVETLAILKCSNTWFIENDIFPPRLSTEVRKLLQAHIDEARSPTPNTRPTIDEARRPTPNTRRVVPKPRGARRRAPKGKRTPTRSSRPAHPLSPQPVLAGGNGSVEGELFERIEEMPFDGSEDGPSEEEPLEVVEDSHEKMTPQQREVEPIDEEEFVVVD